MVEITSEIADNLTHALDRVQTNTRRHLRLMDFCEDLNGKETADDPKFDVFRSIIVFLHADLEDFIRSLGRILLPLADASVLDAIPFVDSSNELVPQKFFLGALVRHRRKTVEELLSDSIDRYLSRRTFNAVAEIDAFLRQLSISTDRFKDLFPYINDLMKRRHQIVHQSDFISRSDILPSNWTGRDMLALKSWNSSVCVLMLEIVAQFHDSAFPESAVQIREKADNLRKSIRKDYREIAAD